LRTDDRLVCACKHPRGRPRDHLPQIHCQGLYRRIGEGLMAQIQLVNIVKKYGDVVACDEIAFTGEEGEFVTLLGPSGCGKSTTLNMIAGLENITGGDLLFDGRRVNNLT